MGGRRGPRGPALRLRGGRRPSHSRRGSRFDTRVGAVPPRNEGRARPLPLPPPLRPRAGGNPGSLPGKRAEAFLFYPATYPARDWCQVGTTALTLPLLLLRAGRLEQPGNFLVSGGTHGTD